MTNHAQAQQLIITMQRLHAGFPSLLGGALHSTHMVTGKNGSIPTSSHAFQGAERTWTVMIGLIGLM